MSKVKKLILVVLLLLIATPLWALAEYDETQRQEAMREQTEAIREQTQAIEDQAYEQKMDAMRARSDAEYREIMREIERLSNLIQYKKDGVK